LADMTPDQWAGRPSGSARGGASKRRVGEGRSFRLAFLGGAGGVPRWDPVPRAGSGPSPPPLAARAAGLPPAPAPVAAASSRTVCAGPGPECRGQLGNDRLRRVGCGPRFASERTRAQRERASGMGIPPECGLSNGIRRRPRVCRPPPGVRRKEVFPYDRPQSPCRPEHFTLPPLPPAPILGGLRKQGNVERLASTGASSDASPSEPPGG